MTPKNAMIFAAGFGTRMGALTKATPKPMLPLGGKPMIDHAIEILRSAGVEKIVANTHYLADILEPHLIASGVLPIFEDPILETGGGLRAALPQLGSEEVITINPDVVWQGPNPATQLGKHWHPDMQACLMLAPAPLGEQGDFDLNSGKITRGGPYKYTGLQILQTTWLDQIRKPAFSLNRYWDYLAARGPLHGVVYNGDWTEIGTIEKLTQAQRLF